VDSVITEITAFVGSTPVIDGVISPGEWTDANKIDRQPGLSSLYMEREECRGKHLPAGIYTLVVRTGGGKTNSFKLVKI